jgi:spermidine synthase
MAVIFFFSGFSSLLYEVVWMRRFSLFFGSDVYSAALTLAAFMGGLTIGSLLAARYVDRLRNTLILYGAIEIAIGIYALCFPTFLGLFSNQLRYVYQTFFELAPWRYNGFRILVASVILLIPTTMMGATLPLVVKRFAENRKVGQSSGLFYSINTLGAIAGVLCVGFVLMPTLGVTRSTWVGVALNVLIGATAIGLGIAGRGKPERATPDDVDASTVEFAAEPGFDPRHGRECLAAIALSGLAALALEVIWMRVLVQSFSSAVYSFSTMLACFLFGIFYGSKKFAGFIDKRPEPQRLFGSLELTIGVTVALLAILTYFVPTAYNGTIRVLLEYFPGRFGVACTVAMILVSLALVGVPTILLGATFPVAVKICTRNVQAAGQGTARVYAANTAGAVTGALLGGLVLIPSFGTRVSLLITAAIFVATGAFLIYRADSGRWKNLNQPQPALLLSLFIIFVIIAGLLPQQIVLNGGTERWSKGLRTIYHGEGTAHTVDILRAPDNTTVMSIGGDVEATTSYGNRRHFILKAELPLLLQEHPRDVAVIGLGLGITLSATARYPGLEQVQVIELSPEMPKAQAHIEDVTGGVLHNPKVRVRIDDGRNFLAMTDRSFDMITADPIHPRNSGVGYLYTREYYEAIKRRLRPGGIVCQWMPMHMMSKQSFDVMFRTFATVFPNASFWYVPGVGLFVATQGPFSIDYQALAKRLEDPAVTADLASIGISGTDDFLSYMLMGPEEISAYLAANPSNVINTDDNAYLEYHIPFELLSSSRTVVAGLVPYAGLDLRIIRNLPEGDKQRLLAHWSNRRNQIVAELQK